MRTSLRALAPQLIRRANGLVGLPDAGSESSMALSSCIDEVEEMEDTEPLLKEKLGCNRGGELLALDMLIRRWLLRCAAADVMGPGKDPMGRADWLDVLSLEDIVIVVDVFGGGSVGGGGGSGSGSGRVGGGGGSGGGAFVDIE